MKNVLCCLGGILMQLALCMPPATGQKVVWENPENGSMVAAFVWKNADMPPTWKAEMAKTFSCMFHDAEEWQRFKLQTGWTVTWQDRKPYSGVAIGFASGSVDTLGWWLSQWVSANRDSLCDQSAKAMLEQQRQRYQKLPDTMIARALNGYGGRTLKMPILWSSEMRHKLSIAFYMQADSTQKAKWLRALGNIAPPKSDDDHAAVNQALQVYHLGDPLFVQTVAIAIKWPEHGSTDMQDAAMQYLADSLSRDFPGVDYHQAGTYAEAYYVFRFQTDEWQKKQGAVLKALQQYKWQSTPTVWRQHLNQDHKDKALDLAKKPFLLNTKRQATAAELNAIWPEAVEWKVYVLGAKVD